MYDTASWSTLVDVDRFCWSTNWLYLVSYSTVTTLTINFLAGFDWAKDEHLDDDDDTDWNITSDNFGPFLSY